MGKFAVIAVTLSVFGPYLVGGVRTDQAVIYGLALVTLPLCLPFIRPAGGMKFLAPWSVMFMVSLIGALFPIRLSLRWGQGGVFAGLDNLMLPLVVMLVLWCTVKSADAEPLLRTAGKIFVWGMTINAVLAIIDTRYELSSFLRPFWAEEGAVTTVGERAILMGRLSGIVNQPSSAGLAYSLAGLLAVYVYARRPSKLYLLLTFITIGGVLTVSKVFLLLGIPLILLYLWKSVSGGGKAGLLFASLAATTAVVQYGLFQRWDGQDMFARLFDPPRGESLIAHYTAGRYADDSRMLDVMAESLRVSPLSGVGAGGMSVAYDSSWTQAIVVAGLIGAGCLTLVLLGFFRLAKTTTEPDRRRLTWFLALLLLPASFGLPALTTNRFGVIVWVVAALLVLAKQNDHEPVTPEASSIPARTSARS